VRLKIRKLLKGGTFSVSFETIGFNSRETKKMRKWGVPTIDLHDIGLGVFPLDQLNFFVRCHSVQEANDVIGNIKHRIGVQLDSFLAQPKGAICSRMKRVQRWRTVSVLGLACVAVFLLITAYKGVIPSQKPASRQKEKSDSTPAESNRKTNAGIFDPTQQVVNQTSPFDLVRFLEDDLKDQPSGSAFSSMQPENASHGLTTLTKPYFTLTVIPEVISRYSKWGTEATGTTDETYPENYKLMLTSSDGFEGPVYLTILGVLPPLEAKIYPDKLDKLPGSSTLIVTFPKKYPPRVFPEITILARGQTSNGNLITRQKKVKVAIRQKSSHRGPVWYVSAEGSDQSGDGSYGSPFLTIQMGTDCAKSGDTVLVDKGIYSENIALIDKEGFVLTSGFIFDGKQSTQKSTIIEAKSPGWVVTIGRSQGITLRGFTIQKGKGQNGSLGGGIYCYNSRVEILDNIIVDNENRSGYGAGIYCYESQLIIARNNINRNRNQEGHGAGIYCYKSDPDITENVISENFAEGGGSAIHLLEPSSASVIRNLIFQQLGSASVVLYNKGKKGTFRVTNNTISHNQGDAIRFFGDSWSFENNIVSQNQGYGFYTLDGTACFSLNNVWANICGDRTVDYCGLEQDPTGTNGNICVDPRFGNPIHGNFRLCHNSPCIGSRNSDNQIASSGGNRTDMGALAYTYPEIICGDVNRDGTIDYGDVRCLFEYLSGNVFLIDPPDLGDVNGDDKIDKDDLAYLYNFLYFYGPGPRPLSDIKDRLTTKQ
jgi:hypothetical protein